MTADDAMRRATDGAKTVTQAPGLRRTALVALLWSVIQHWGGRSMATVVFVLLARLLHPAEFGIASSAFLIMSFLSLVAEFGYGDAIIQRRGLKPEDITLPFYASVAASLGLAAATALLARPIAGLFGAGTLAPYIVGAALLCPLMMIVSFQEALYRKALRFQALAMRTFAAVALGGVVGVACALGGLGSWSMIAQFGAQLAVSALWLWRRPEWRPTRAIDTRSFRSLTSFGSGVVGMRVVDFVTLRSVDLIILTTYGAAALGLFSVASRLYQLLMQLFQTSISNVGLSVLSRVADDRARLARLFERSSSISAMIGTPVFLGLAALAPEVNVIMFGPRWIGADQVMRPLLLVGGLHCIQFTMGTYLTALGQPRTLLRLMLLKALLVLPAVLFWRMGSVASLATLFACALALETPFILAATLRGLSLDWKVLVRPVGLMMLASGIALCVADAVRSTMPLPSATVLRAAILGCVFVSVNMIAALALAPGAVAANFRFVRQTFR